MIDFIMSLLGYTNNKKIINKRHELVIFKEFHLNFMSDTGLNPLLLGRFYDYTIKEKERICSKIDVKKNPVHYTIFKIYSESLKRTM